MSPATPGGEDPADSEEDEFDQDPGEQVRLAASRAGVILPSAAWKEWWDVFVLNLILYSAVMVPYRICFDADAIGYMWFFEQGVTFIFITDVVFLSPQQ